MAFLEQGRQVLVLGLKHKKRRVLGPRGLRVIGLLDIPLPLCYMLFRVRLEVKSRNIGLGSIGPAGE